MQKKAKTSWGEVAEWYQRLLAGEGTYQKEVILPNLLRLLEIKKGLPTGRQGETILDLACGPGFFTNEFYKHGAKVIGADISSELIKIAKKNAPPNIKYFVSSADKLSFLTDKSVDKITLILSIQNIENVSEVFKECARILKSGGKLFLVMNHPAFRVPKESSWGWDPSAGSGQVPSVDSAGSQQAGSLAGRALVGQAGQVPSAEPRTGVRGVQYRRIDSYLSESKVKIQMRPSAGSGQGSGEHTLTFHRPLQFYFKALQKTGFLVSRLEEWNSNKKSEPGPRALAENRARKEIPLFLFLEAVVR